MRPAGVAALPEIPPFNPSRQQRQSPTGSRSSAASVDSNRTTTSSQHGQSRPTLQNSVVQKDIENSKRFLADSVNILKQDGTDNQVLHKKLLILPIFPSVCNALKIRLGNSDKDVLHAHYLFGVALMVPFEKENSISEQRWLELKTRVMKMMQYMSSDTLRIPTLQDRDAFKLDLDDSAYDEEQIPNMDMRIAINAQQMDNKWLQKTIEVFEFAIAGYVKLRESKQLAVPDLLRWSHAHSRISECYSMLLSPEHALKHAQKALDVLMISRNPPSNLVMAAHTQIAVCQRLFADYLVGIAVENIEKVLVMALKEKVETELKLMKIAQGNAKPVDVEALKNSYNHQRATVVQEYSHLVKMLQQADRELNDDQAKEKATKFMEEVIDEIEREAGGPTNWKFIAATDKFGLVTDLSPVPESTGGMDYLIAEAFLENGYVPEDSEGEEEAAINGVLKTNETAYQRLTRK